MQDKYKVAKQQGLNWQALLIEETQGELKKLIKDLYLKGKSFVEINKQVVKVIEGLVDDLENTYLKEITKPAMFEFATRIYYNVQSTFGGLNLFQVIAMGAIIGGFATLQQTQTVREVIKKSINKEAYLKAVPLDTYAKDYMKMVEEKINYLAGMDAKEDYSDRVTLRNIAEREVRAEHQAEMVKGLIDKNENLVWIEPHANCSERCQKWQGKLYSLNNSYGEVEGVKYQPLENATNVYETTRAGKIYKNGCISGFNCRHKLIPYRQNNKPVEIPAKVVDKEREINDKQRYLERGVRNWKEKALLYKDIMPQQYVMAKNKAKEWNEKYIEFSINNKVAYYPSRIEII